jgi:hypothetical protein
MKITVITPTIRPDGLAIVRAALKQQTFRDFEWLIGSKFDPGIKEARWIRDNFEGGYWSLNRIYNKLIKEAKGELIVSLQDWIAIAADGLEKFWITHEEYPDAIVSGVGDQYESLDKFGKVQIKIWSDPRKRLDQGSFYEIFPTDAEFNWCAFPRKAAFDVGGFDENLDMLGVGGDQLQFCARLDTLGYKFYIDQTNESFTIRHGREDFGGEDEWNNKHVLFNGKYDEEIAQLKKEGKWPKLDYLKKA